MDEVKFFIGPMSKNIVDSIIEFSNEKGIKFGLIPSRRQIELFGGYVNNWTTENFCRYVNSLAQNIILQRDHAGPMQGYLDDDGYQSLTEDSKYFNLIHIDPWKKYNQYNDGLKWTVDMIRYCNNINPDLQYEVGTEQAIRKFDTNELEKFIIDLKYQLESDGLFNKIKYLVIQSGTSLKGNTQTGEYDKDRLIKMVNISKKYGLLSKEHNGDYIPIAIIKEKFDLGLDAINIAPEFGLIETQTFLDEITDTDIFEDFWKICYDSKRWEKWVDKNFNPLLQKENLVKICGHYVLSQNDFLEKIKSKIPNIDIKIKKNIKAKLNNLYELY